MVCVYHVYDIIRGLVEFGWCDSIGVCDFGEVDIGFFLGLISVRVSQLVEVDERFRDGEYEGRV